MNRRDWLLLALAAAGGQSLTPAQLQKSLFLFGERAPAIAGANYYKFIPYHYGPFDSSIYSDVEALASEGLVMIAGNGRWMEYSATRAGLDRAIELNRQAGSGGAYIAELVRWARSLTFQQLIRAVYSEFPAYRANSVFRD